jgi:hypothetical protein
VVYDLVVPVATSEWVETGILDYDGVPIERPVEAPIGFLWEFFEE